MTKLCLPLVFILLATVALVGCGGSEDPQVLVDSTPLEFSPEPQFVDGVMMVPGLQLFRALYGEPVWDEESATLGIQHSDFIFLVQAGNNYANLNDNPYPLPVTPQKNGSELMVPLEAIVQALGYKVQWNGSTASIVTDAQKVELSQREALLVGTWSDMHYFGELYDAVTGLPKTSAYSGEWYIFWGDGTFRYIIAGSGQFISGVVMNEGKYKLQGDELVLYSTRSSWYPNLDRPSQAASYEDKPVEDERLPLIFEGLDTIRIDEDIFYLQDPNS